MPFNHPPEKVKEVKKLLGKMSLRAIAREVKISYYSVWLISKGLNKVKKIIDTPREVYKPTGRFFKVDDFSDWITGEKTKAA